MKNLGLQLYRKIIGVFPEIVSMHTGEGNLLKFDDTRELHLNVTSSGNEASTLMLNFFNSANEEACYEIHIDHAQRTASAETVRAETVQPLYSRLAQAERSPSKIRTLLSRSGRAETNQSLFRKLQSLISNLDQVGTGKLEIHILQNDPMETTLEISPINIDDISRMTVSLDKKNQSAGVVEISGSFGRYPAYLPYPDGKEMTPQEREGYSQMLLEYMGKEGRKPSRTVSRG